MKSLFLFTIAISFCSFKSFSQTTVPGVTYKSNKVWTESGSPYNITGNIGIPSGITLTIDSGVVVNYIGNFQIIIQGTLIAKGSVKQPITFNGNAPGSPMILFQKAILDNSLLSHITINGPKDGIKLSMNSSDNNSGTLTISSLKIANSKIETNGYSSSATLEIKKSSLINTKVIGQYPLSEAITISNSVIEGGELTSDSYNAGIFLSQDTTQFTNFIAGCCGGNINVSSSVISEGSFQQGGGQPGSYNILNIENSKLSNTVIDMPVSTGTIKNTSFTYNQNYSKSSCVVIGNGTIEQCDFKGKGSLTAIERTSTTYDYDNNKAFLITNNKFKGFDTDIYLYSSPSTNLGIGPVSITYNSFLDTPKILTINNLTPFDVFAQFNHWQTNNEDLIDNTIYDFWDNILYGKVDYTNAGSPLGLKSDKIVSQSIITYPNPFKELLNINTNGKDRISVINMIGQEILTLEISNDLTTIDLKELKEGIYILKLIKDNVVTNESKIIKF